MNNLEEFAYYILGGCIGLSIALALAYALSFIV